MWQTADDARFTRAVNASHEVNAYVELWSNGTKLSGDVPYTDGSVTDTWVISGVRRSLSLSVPPTDQWQSWLDYPALELRPYRGIRFSPFYTMDCPLGRYPLLMPEMNRPVAEIKIDVDDYYQRIEQADYPYPTRTVRDTAVGAIRTQLLDGNRQLFAGWRDIVTTSTNTALTPAIWTENSRAATINEWAKSFGLEVFLSREGIPVIADARALRSAQTDLLVGQAVETLAIKPDWDKVFNVMVVSSGVSNVDFPPVVAAITDRNHPASPTKIGERVRKYSSDYILTIADARKAAPRLLQKVSGRAQVYSYQCIPDPRRDAGDSIRCSLLNGTTTVAQIETVTHPLLADGKQNITTLSTQKDIELSTLDELRALVS